VMYEEDICDQKIYSFTGEVCMYVSNSCDEDGSMYIHTSSGQEVF
jgi:hypothetical protein